MTSNAADGQHDESRLLTSQPDQVTDDAQQAVDAGDDCQEKAAVKFPIAGIGGSAGGYEAFVQVLKHLRAEPGIALVYVSHLLPGHVSAMTELLGQHSPVPVSEITDGLAIGINRLYVLPPDALLEMAEGKFRLIERPKKLFAPIDHFFRSLATEAGSCAIGVVLSGSSSDGAAGLRDIKAAGGIVIVQEPSTTQHDSMARAALATGIVDLVLPPEEIARELAAIEGHPYVQTPTASSSVDFDVSDDQLRHIFRLLRTASGVDFTHYKPPTIKRRMHRRMALHKVKDVEAYIRLMEEHPAEAVSLFRDILIHVTRFFREPDSFEALRRLVFPEIVSRWRGESPIRIWIPGCATGEEAYSVAIALTEYLNEQGTTVPIQLFGTDVSDLSIETARAGIYSESIQSDVSAERLRRYFSRVDGHYRITKAVRDLCVFARQDLTRDPPFSKLDLVVCRNVLIYMGPVLQKQLMHVFHYALRPNGFLMLGSAESTGASAELFTIVDKKRRVHVKKGADLAISPLAPEFTTTRLAGASRPKPPVRASDNLQSEADRLIVERYGPPGVVVDLDLQIIHFRGSTGRFLEPVSGDASLNLAKMVREGMLYPLRSAIQEARQVERPVRRENVKAKFDRSTISVNLDVIPLRSGGEGQHFLIIFEEVPATVPVLALPPTELTSGNGDGESTDGRVEELLEEIRATRGYLQSMIQDLEAANEELQSANEEILSSNEELQSTNEELDTAKEELQSTNEEIVTVNEELQTRNEELSRANSDLVNLLASIQIAIVMVDSDLRIRRFTPMAEKVLNVIPGDIGRPIGQIRPSFYCPDLDRWITEVIDTVTQQDREVQDASGNWLAMRIRPYKNAENRIDGAVVAIIDVTSAKRHKSEIESSRAVAQGILNSLNDPLAIADQQLRIKIANPAFFEALALPLEELQGTQMLDRYVRHPDLDVWRRQLSLMAMQPTSVDSLEVEADVHGVRKALVCHAVPQANGESLILIAVRGSMTNEAAAS